MAQAKALDALAPFLALSKTSNSPRQTADVISQATSHPNTFVFAELLQTPRVRELAAAEPQYAAHLVALRIFSYGTYADYVRGTPPQTAPQSQPSPSPLPLPALSAAQKRKLRQLSLITLATDHASLTYDHLISALSLAGGTAGPGTDAGDAKEEVDAELEALVVSAIYAGLVVATLDPASRIVRISSVAPLRDVAPGSLPKLHASLRGWAARCETTLADLDAQIAGIRKAAAARADAEQQWDAKFKRALDDERKTMLGWAAPGNRTVTLNVGAAGSHAMQRQQQRQQQQQPPMRVNNKRGSSDAAHAETDPPPPYQQFVGGASAGNDDDAYDDDDDGFDDDVFDDGAMDLDESHT